MKHSFKNSNETGRTMVEMLGVLAIVGVLSVMGIWGYTIAMIRYRANEVLYEAHKRAVVLVARIAGGDKGRLQSATEEELDEGIDYSNLTYYDLPEFGEQDVFGVKFPNEAELERRKLYIQVQEVPKKICNSMQGIVGDGSQGIMGIDFVGENEECDDNNTLDIVFNDDLSPNVRTILCGDEGKECARCQVCQNGICVDDDSKCGGGAVCSLGICQCTDGGEMCGNKCCVGDNPATEAYDPQQVCGNKNGVMDCIDVASLTKCQPGHPTCETAPCTSNSDCQQNQYCDVGGLGHGTCAPAKGGCRTLPAGCAKKTNSNGRTVCALHANKDAFYSWWAAENACAKMNGHLASLAELGMEANYGACLEYNSGVQEYCGEYWMREGTTVSPNNCVRSQGGCVQLPIPLSNDGLRFHWACAPCNNNQRTEECTVASCQILGDWMRTTATGEGEWKTITESPKLLDKNKKTITEIKYDTENKTYSFKNEDGEDSKPAYRGGGWILDFTGVNPLQTEQDGYCFEVSNEHTCKESVEGTRLQSVLPADAKTYWTASTEGCMPYLVSNRGGKTSIGRAHDKATSYYQALCILD